VGEGAGGDGEELIFQDVFSGSFVKLCLVVFKD